MYVSALFGYTSMNFYLNHNQMIVQLFYNKLPTGDLLNAFLSKDLYSLHDSITTLLYFTHFT